MGSSKFLSWGSSHRQKIPHESVVVGRSSDDGYSVPMCASPVFKSGSLDRHGGLNFLRGHSADSLEELGDLFHVWIEFKKMILCLQNDLFDSRCCWVCVRIVIVSRVVIVLVVDGSGQYFKVGRRIWSALNASHFAFKSFIAFIAFSVRIFWPKGAAVTSEYLAATCNESASQANEQRELME